MNVNKCCIKIIVSVPFSAEDLQNTDGTSDDGAFPWKDSSPTWPEAEPAVGTWIRSGSVGTQGVFSLRWLFSISSFLLYLFNLFMFFILRRNLVEL